MKQFIHAHDVRINHADPDRSTATSYLEAKPIYHGESYLVAGRFGDGYLRVDGRWLFATATLKFGLWPRLKRAGPWRIASEYLWTQEDQGRRRRRRWHHAHRALTIRPRPAGRHPARTDQWPCRPGGCVPTG